MLIITSDISYFHSIWDRYAGNVSSHSGWNLKENVFMEKVMLPSASGSNFPQLFCHVDVFTILKGENR